MVANPWLAVVPYIIGCSVSCLTSHNRPTPHVFDTLRSAAPVPMIVFAATTMRLRPYDAPTQSKTSPTSGEGPFAEAMPRTGTPRRSRCSILSSPRPVHEASTLNGSEWAESFPQGFVMVRVERWSPNLPSTSNQARPDDSSSRSSNHPEGWRLAVATYLLQDWPRYFLLPYH